MHYRRKQTKSKSRRSRSKKGGEGVLEFLGFGTKPATEENNESKGMLSWLFPPKIQPSAQIPVIQPSAQIPVRQSQPQVVAGGRRRRQQTKKCKK